MIRHAPSRNTSNAVLTAVATVTRGTIVTALTMDDTKLAIKFSRGSLLKSSASAAFKTLMEAAIEVSGMCVVAWTTAGNAVAEVLGYRKLEKMPVPGLLVASSGKAVRAMKLPRNKADFTAQLIVDFVHGRA